MASPSQDWPGFAGLSPEEETYKKIDLVLSSANFAHLKERAIHSRRKHYPSLPFDIDCNINLTQFATGYNNVVLKITFSDDICWVARIPYRTIDDSTKTSLLSEIATMNFVRQRTSIPIPRIFEFDISTDGPFGYPYVLMEHLGGRTLDNVLAFSIPPQHHTKVAKQLATVFAQLQTLTFDCIGRLSCGETADQPVGIISMDDDGHHSPGPLETSLEYFYNQRHAQNRKISPCTQTMKTHIVIEDRVRGPFPLCHLDLHFGNMLFDEEYNLVGVIDWSSAQAAPLKQLSVCPELAIFPALSDEENQPIVDFKKLVVQFLKELEDDKLKGKDKEEQRLALLSAYMASERVELMHYQLMTLSNWARMSPWLAKRIADIIYGEHITWEQLKKVYGRKPLL
ncbi:kinase-like domain-containing protein [Podospora fimiseda]|uniref:Kinase-like domain-containing protein n=1 Tax=Podospora fimiseda TaxID=252190 RepID=A0AAN7BYY0_9PEZI|nr:kinase-like domain-containing protein [Podospora fimiseda]